MTRVAVGSALFGLLFGVVLGRLSIGESQDPDEESQAPPPDSPDSPIPQTGHLALAAPSGAAACPPADQASVERVAERDAMIESLEFELYGEPLEWTEQVPDVQRQAAYADAMQEVVEQCKSDWSLGELDCAEPPCMQVVWNPGNQSLNECAAWTERYGVATSGMSSDIDCGDGRTERIYILSPTATAYKNGAEMIADQSMDPVERENLIKRMNTRWQRIARETPCTAVPAAP